MDRNLDSLTALLKPMIEQCVKEALRESKVMAKTVEKKSYPEVVSVDTAAEITGYKRSSLYQMHARGEVPGAFKMGRKLLFKTSELKTWVENAQYGTCTY